LFAPAGTSKTTIDRLNAEMRRVGEIKKVTDRLFENGLEYKPSTPAELREMLVAERKLYVEIVKSTGAKTD